MNILPPGELATVVTFLQMRKPPRSPVPSSPLSLERIEQPSPDEYRELFRRVGARWLWFSRLVMDDHKLSAIIHDRRVEVHSVVSADGSRLGIAELDFRNVGRCELAFIGLVPELAGKGHGRWLLAEALRLAWRSGVSLVEVHTCTLDHPAALPSYRRAGFTAVKRAVERFPDPRLLGILPAGCAPQVPLLGTVTSSDSAPET